MFLRMKELISLLYTYDKEVIHGYHIERFYPGCRTGAASTFHTNFATLTEI